MPILALSVIYWSKYILPKRGRLSQELEIRAIRFKIKTLKYDPDEGPFFVRMLQYVYTIKLHPLFNILEVFCHIKMSEIVKVSKGLSDSYPNFNLFKPGITSHFRQTLGWNFSIPYRVESAREINLSNHERDCVFCVTRSTFFSKLELRYPFLHYKSRKKKLSLDFEALKLH